MPKQTGTPDSCTTQNEEEIFDYQDQHDLITLGWIHVRITLLVKWKQSLYGIKLYIKAKGKREIKVQHHNSEQE